MTKATRILNKYHIKNMLLSGKTQFDNFYKEELIQFCKVAKAEIEQASKEKQELINYLKVSIEFEKSNSLWSSKKRLKVYEEILSKIESGEK